MLVKIIEINEKVEIIFHKNKHILMYTDELN